MIRLASGIVLILLTVAAVWLAPPSLFLAVMVGLALLGVYEYVRLAAGAGSPMPLFPVAAASVLACLTFSELVFPDAQQALAIVFMSAMLAIGGLAVTRWNGTTRAQGSVGAALLPIVYVGLPLGAMIGIREEHGPPALFLLMLTIIVSDTSQYYAGRLLGKRPLAPAVSPNKTIEGAVAGFVMGALLLTVAGAWWLPFVPLPLRAALGVLVVVLGIVGDLFESMLKRSAGAKDSSALIPGHGGLLDRIDALLFAAPVYFIVLKALQAPV